MTNVMRAAFGLTAVPPWTQSAPAQTSPSGAKVYFVNLKDGQDVTTPFLVKLGLSSMGVAPAGVEKANTGRHHPLIDGASISNAQIFA